MLSALGKIFDVLVHLPEYVLWGVVSALNALIAAVGFLIVELLALLPSMPAVPTLPTGIGDALGWMAWFYPVGDVLAGLTVMLGLWTAVLLIRIALKWAKAL